MPGEKLFGVLSSQRMSLLGFELRPHWWDLNALTSYFVLVRMDFLVTEKPAKVGNFFFFRSIFNENLTRI